MAGESLNKEDSVTVKGHRLRRWLWRGMLIVLAWSVTAAASLYLHPVAFRGILQRRLSKALDAEVSLGRLRLSMGSDLTVSTDKLSLRSADGLWRFRADSARWKLDWLPLLSGRVVLGEVEVEDAELRLVQAADNSWPAWLLNMKSDRLDLEEAQLEMKRVRVRIERRTSRQAIPTALQIDRLRILPLHERTGLTFVVEGTLPGNGVGQFIASGQLLFPFDPGWVTSVERLDLSLHELDIGALMACCADSSVTGNRGEGTVTAKLRVSRTRSDALRAIGKLTVRHVRRPFSQPLKLAMEIASGEVQFQATIDRQAIRLDRASGRVSGHEFTLRGKITDWLTEKPLVSGEVATADVRLTPGVKRLIQRFLPLPARSLMERLQGTVQVSARVHGPLKNPQPILRVRVKEATVLPSDADLRIKHVVGEFTMKNPDMGRAQLQGQALGGSWRLEGSVSRQGLDVRVTARSVNLAHGWQALRQLWPLATDFDRLKRAHGLADAAFRIRGHWSRPAVSGQAEIVEGCLILEGLSQPLRRLRGEIRFNNQALRTDRLEGKLGHALVSLRGQMVFQGDRWRPQVHVTLPSVDISQAVKVTAGWLPWLRPSLETGDMSDFVGTMAAEISYTDTGLSARIVLEKVGFRSGRVPEPVSNVSGRIEMVGDRLRLEGGHGVIGDSKFVVSGTVENLMSNDPRWTLDGEATLSFPQASALLPNSLQPRLKVSGPLPIRWQASGSFQAVRLEAAGPLTADLAVTIGSAFRKDGRHTGEFHLVAQANRDRLTLSDAQVRLNDLQMSLRGEVTQLTSGEPRLALTVETPPAVSARTAVSLLTPTRNLSVSRGEMRLTATLTGHLSQPTVRGTVQLSNLELPHLLGGIAGLSGDFHFSEEAVHVDALTLTLAGAPVQLSGQWRRDGTGSLQAQIDQFNLDTFLPELVTPQAMPPGLKDFWLASNSRIAIYLRRGQFLNLPLEDVRTDLLLMENIIELRPITFRLAGGSGQVTAHIDLRDQCAHVQVKLSDAEAGAVFSSLPAMPPEVLGKFSLTADLTGSGFALKRFLQSARGTGRFKITEGKLERASLSQRILLLALMAHEGPYGFKFHRFFRSLTAPRIKRFRLWKGDVRLDNGVLRSSNVLLDADIVAFAMAGDLNLVTSEIDAHVEGRMTDLYVGQSWLGRLLMRFSFEGLVDAIRGLGNWIARRPQREQHIHRFTFRVKGKIDGDKTIEEFKFVQ